MSTDTTPESSQALTARQTTALERPASTYSSESFVTPGGLGVSKETTVWHEVPVRGPREEDLLDEAARLAARSYGESLLSMTLGVLGPGRASDVSARGPSLYFRPFGLYLIELMGFTPLASTSQVGEHYFPVHRGLLASRTPVNETLGSLFFRWQREGRDEVFQTEVRDFVPRLAGRRRSWLGLKFYKYTQQLVHRVVMWGYHLWIRRHRVELLERARQSLLEHEQRAGAQTPELLDN